MSTPDDKQIRNERVELDGKTFDGYTFDHCNMVFKGTGNLRLENCMFLNCNWTFEGPAAATIEFMRLLYGLSDDSKELIEKTFDQIRGA